jgi:hypothetical protein
MGSGNQQRSAGVRGSQEKRSSTTERGRTGVRTAETAADDAHLSKSARMPMKANWKQQIHADKRH